MKGRPLIIIALTLFLILTATTSYWYTTSNKHNTFTSLLSPLRSSPSSPHSTPNDAFPITKTVAVIIETRPLTTLIPLILHFTTILGPTWPILLLTRRSTIHTLSAYGHGSAAFKRLLATGQVKILELPTDSHLKNYLGISHFLASKWFWNLMGSAEYMLNFQTDSVLCGNSGRTIEDFFGFAFVGAWHPYAGGAYNGGLSLRNVSLAREVVQKYDIADDVGELGSGDGVFEDVWFCNKMRGLGGTFPDEKTASGFSVDLVWGERPLGYHGVNKSSQYEKLGEEKVRSMFRWCPEAALAAKAEIVGLNEEEGKINVTDVDGGETEGGARLYMD